MHKQYGDYMGDSDANYYGSDSGTSNIGGANGHIFKKLLYMILNARRGWKERNNRKAIASIKPDDYRAYLEKWFSSNTGETLDLDSPQTFNQKIQWLKLYDSTPLKGTLSDKYLVRSYVSESIGSQYLIPLLGVWDDPHSIDFAALPDKFVLKATHGCGWNIIVRNKETLDQKLAIKQLEKWLQINYANYPSLELHYNYCEPRIIAEAYITNSNQDLYDYKFWCFDGRVEYIQFLSERSSELRMNFFDREWHDLGIRYNHPSSNKLIPRPDNLDTMIRLAEKLSEGFPHVRVDFYRLDDGSIYFGELTFTSFGGVCDWDPPSADYDFGAMINLDPLKKTKRTS